MNDFFDIPSGLTKIDFIVSVQKLTRRRVVFCGASYGPILVGASSEKYNFRTFYSQWRGLALKGLSIKMIDLVKVLLAYRLKGLSDPDQLAGIGEMLASQGLCRLL